MKKHNGMRPLDIAVLLKILILKDQKWTLADLSRSLHISYSEISESLNRSRIGKLLSADNKTVFRNSLFEFLQFGLKYVFPVSPGTIARGIPTAHCAKPISEKMIPNNEIYVWAFDEGKVRGQVIEPLYKKAVNAAIEDSIFYEYLSLIDAIRVGNTREVSIAKEELKLKIFN